MSSIVGRCDSMEELISTNSTKIRGYYEINYLLIFKKIEVIGGYFSSFAKFHAKEAFAACYITLVAVNAFIIMMTLYSTVNIFRIKMDKGVNYSFFLSYIFF